MIGLLQNRHYHLQVYILWRVFGPRKLHIFVCFGKFCLCILIALSFFCVFQINKLLFIQVMSGPDLSIHLNLLLKSVILEDVQLKVDLINMIYCLAFIHYFKGDNRNYKRTF